MIRLYLRMALKSLGQNPGLTAIMVATVALGIAACVTVITMFHAMSADPIWWKSDRLYAVTLDSWDVNEPPDAARPHLPPPRLTYRDAMHLLESNIPERKTVMYVARTSILSNADRPPIAAEARFTRGDFFPMFDVPFQYGGSWSVADDTNAAPVIVLSKEVNETLFGGDNSVGRIVRWNDREFRIVGVLDTWEPQPKFYDLNRGHFEMPEGAYIPFRWGPQNKVTSASGRCWKPEPLDSYEDILGSECTWQQMWVELPDAATRERMQDLLDTYTTEQRKSGRFQRPQNNRLTNVPQWLIDQGVVQNDNRVLVGLAFAFLAVCLLNVVGLLLAKFLNAAKTIGIRRALGARKGQIFAQYFVEAAVVSTLGAALGLALGALSLKGLSIMYTVDEATRGGYRELLHFDVSSVVVAIALAAVATVVGGFYPAWRAARLPPAVYLKSQ
ncbi:ABC transporter permease [Peristeroidobacter agariperforans]|uniref:ABC transporter permease n=1 Tax=Peristeroidobacter agariperforans TaxID=268404 RepID=UPI00101C044B|nr:ABC transporter permease [Peristeroidobacter agariperforans]